MSSLFRGNNPLFLPGQSRNTTTLCLQIVLKCFHLLPMFFSIEKAPSWEGAISHINRIVPNTLFLSFDLQQSPFRFYMVFLGQEQTLMANHPEKPRNTFSNHLPNLYSVCTIHNSISQSPPKYFSNSLLVFLFTLS